ncbi:MAG: hypothetical protein HIU90_07385 [Proteobacteria bacterium]|nr:hypothetical protein [Pseudomonadota bacterium]
MTRKFESIISILDKASAPLMAIEEKMRNLGTRAKKTEVEIKEIGATSLLKSRIGEDIHAIGAKLHHVGHAIHHHLEGPMEKVGGAIEKVVDAVPLLGALGGLGSMAGFVEGIRNTAELSEKLHNLSVVSGMSVPALQRLQFQVHDTGVSTDQMAVGLGRLNANIGLAAMGHNKALLSLFSSLHINLRNANGSIRDASSILPQLMDDLSKTKSTSEQAAIATKLFGRTGRELLPFLDQGSAKLDELNKRFAKYGHTLSGKDQAGLEKFTHSWNDLELAVSGVVQQLSADLSSALAPVLKDFAGWIALEGKLVSKRLKADLSWLELKIKNFDWKKFRKDGGAAFQDIETAASALWAVMHPIIEGIQALQAVHKWEKKTLDPVHNYLYGQPVAGTDSLPANLRPKASRMPRMPSDPFGGLLLPQPRGAGNLPPAGLSAYSSPRLSYPAAPRAASPPASSAPVAMTFKHEHHHVIHGLPKGASVSSTTKTTPMPNPSIGQNGTIKFQQW